MFLSEGALVLSEIDNGPTVEALTGGGDMEYFLSIQGEERLIHVLELLGGEVGRPLVVLLDEAGLAQLADALRERFGNDLNLLRSFREWLVINEIRYEEVVR